MEGELPRISRDSGRGALAPRHGECEMRGSESPLTINVINVNRGNFGGHFSCMCEKFHALSMRRSYSFIHSFYDGRT